MRQYVSGWMDEELDMLKDAVRRFFHAEVIPNDERWNKQKHVDRSFWKKAGEMGILCASVPTEYGGGGGTFAHEAVIFQEQGYAACTSFGNHVHSGITAHYILNYGTEEQKKRWLPDLASGRKIAAIAMTESGAGSDLQAMTTRAVVDGDSYVVNGSKTFISNGSQADIVVLAVKTDSSLGSKGISLLVVDAEGLSGFRRGRVLEKMGMHGQDTAELFFDDMRVPKANLLGREGEGFVQLMQQLPQERLLIGIQAVGTMERAVELTIEYAKERKAFGKPIIDFQNTRFVLADCKTNVQISRVFLDSCIERHLRGELDTATASMVKYWITDKQTQVLDACLQVFGGYGYMSEYPISRMYADSRIQRIYGGTNEIMKEVIARTL